MSWFSRLSIRAKLTLVVMTTTCAALLVAVAVMSVMDELTFRTRMREGAEAAAQSIAKRSARALMVGNRRSVAELLNVLRGNPDVQAAAVYDQSGRLFASFVRPGSETAVLAETLATAGGRWDVISPVELNGGQLGTVLLRFDGQELRERRAHQLWLGLTVLVAAAGVGFLLATRLQRFISRPILQLAETARTVVDRKDYAVRAPKNAEDELGQLVDGFNGMLAQIEAREQALRQVQAELEQRVTERTRDLFEANRNLQAEVQAHKQAQVESEALWKQLQSAYQKVQQEAVERTQMQLALQRSEERFAKAFRSSPVPLAILTRDQRVFVDVNDRFADLAGRPLAEIVGQPMTSLPLWMESETRARIEALLMAGEALRNWQCRLTGPDGTSRVALLSGEPLMLGDEACVLLVTEDVTERANLEAQLRQAQKMDAIGQLAAGVAHDFNNLLTVLQGYNQMLLATQSPGNPGHEVLGKMMNAIQRAGQLTGQLLTFSRKEVAQPKYVDVNKVVTNVVGMLRPLLGETIRLTVRPASKLPAIMADPAMLEQVLVNLAVNGRDAMPRGGELIVATFSSEIGRDYARTRPQARTGHFVCLEVSDTGCGMDAATMERIFEPFFTTKGVGKGTGLGLTTVYGIVKQHHGWVEVASRVGGGSRFKVFLPAAPSPASQTELIAADPVRGGDETVLVVEDEPSLRELITKILRHYGYRVMEASHGREAIKVWQSATPKPALLLTDMMMPEGMTGWELAEQIRAGTPEMKVLFTSGYSPELFSGEVRLDGRANFLPKPFHPRKLAQTVRRCLDK